MIHIWYFLFSSSWDTLLYIDVFRLYVLYSQFAWGFVWICDLSSKFTVKTPDICKDKDTQQNDPFPTPGRAGPPLQRMTFRLADKKKNVQRVPVHKGMVSFLWLTPPEKLAWKYWKWKTYHIKTYLLFENWWLSIVMLMLVFWRVLC